MTKLFRFLTCLLMLGTLMPSLAQEVQIGTVNDNYQFKSSNVPFYTMSKNGEGMVMYKKALLTNIPDGSLIKSMAFKGTQTTAGRIYDSIEIYMANVDASTTNLDSFVINNPDGDGTIANTDAMEHFATLTEYEFQVSSTVTDILSATSDKGFKYTGGNIMIYMKAVNCHGSGTGGAYTTFFQTGTTAFDNRSNGKYHNWTYESQRYTNKWDNTGNSGQGINVPVVTFGLGAADETLTYKQIGSVENPMSYKNRTSYMPFYTMSKYGQGISLYKKGALALDANSLIKELSFYAHSTKEGVKYNKIEVYLANTSENSVDGFIIPGEKEGNAETTVVDLSKMTLFASCENYEVPPCGTDTEYAEAFKFESTEGFNYTGENLVVFINAGTTGSYPSCNFATATNSGTDWRNVGKYRDSGYTTVGYGINTKKWSDVGSGNGSNVPVMKVGIGGGVQIVIPATVKGAVTNARNNASIAGATVKLNDLTATTGSDGRYEINVENVDMSATYTLSVEAAGFETATKTIDIKSGGEFTENFALTKLPVPATLSGKVVSATDATVTIAGAALSFNGISATSGEDGSYSFAIANVDDLPNDGAALTAEADGYIDYANNLKVTGDMTFNIEMTPQGEIPGEGTLIGKFNYKDYSYQLPIYTLWRYSINEMIYPASALTGLQAGDKIGSVSFYGYSPLSEQPGTGGDDGGDDDDDDYNDYWSAPAKAAGDKWYSDIKVYMVDSEADAFTADYTATDLTELTPLFEGRVEIAEGTGSAQNPAEIINVTFDKAYTYGGGNMKLIVVADSPLSKIIYFATDKSFASNGIQDSGSNPIAEPKMQLVKNGLPVMRLGKYIPTGIVKGIVTNVVTEAPLADAEVILGEGASRVTVSTDETGAYNAVMRNIEFGKAYRIVASCGDYNDFSGQVKFSEEKSEVNLDIELDYNVTITGTVWLKEDNKELAPAGGATVSYGEATATTDASGVYTLEIENVTESPVTIKATSDTYSTSEQVEVAAPGEFEKDIVIAFSGIFTIEDVEEGKVKVFTIDGLQVNADNLEKGRPYIMINSEGKAKKALLK